MRSQLAVRRPHITQTANNKRKSRGKAAKAAQRRKKQWQLSAVLIDPLAVIRAQVFAALSLATAVPNTEISEQERQKRALKRKQKKSAQKEEDTAAIAEKQRKAAERAARAEQREAEKRRVEEEEYQKWKAAQAAKEAEDAKLVEEEKLQKKAAKPQKATKGSQKIKDASKNDNESKSTEDSKKKNSAPSEQPAKNVEVPATESKKSKKNKKHSESDVAPAQTAVEEPVQKVEVAVNHTEAPAESTIEKSGKKNKKNKKNSESEVVPAPTAVEEPVQKVEVSKTQSEAPAVPVPNETPVETSADVTHDETSASQKSGKKNKKSKSKNNSVSEPASVVVEDPVQEVGVKTGEAPTPTAADDTDFLDFVTKKEDRTAAATEHEEPIAEEPAHEEKTQSKNSKKNKKNKSKTNSISEPAPVVVEEPIQKAEVKTEGSPAPAAADDTDFLDFVTKKEDRTAAATEHEEPIAEEPAHEEKTQSKNSKKNKKNKSKTNSVSEPASVVVEEPIQKAEVKTEGSPAPAAADDTDFLDFVTKKEDRTAAATEQEEPIAEEPVHEEKTQSKSSKKNKKNKSKNNSVSEPAPVVVEQPVQKTEVKTEEAPPPAAADDTDFLDFVTKKEDRTAAATEHEEPIAEEPVHEEKTQSKSSKKNKKNKSKNNSVSEPAPVDVEEPIQKVNAGTVEGACISSQKKGEDNKKTGDANKQEPEVVDHVEERFEKVIVAPTTDGDNDIETGVDAAAGIHDETPVKKSGKKNKKARKSESETTPPVEVETAVDSLDFLDFVTSKENRQAAAVEDEETAPVGNSISAPTERTSGKKKNKKNKKNSENDSAPVQVEASAKKVGVAEKTPSAPSDDLDFLDFVTTKDNRHASAVAEDPSAEESVVAEQTSGKSKKNKKNKKHSESETSPSQVEEPVKKVEVLDSTASAPPDDLDFLDFVTTKDNRHAAAVAGEPTAEESVVAEQTSGKSKKNKKNKKLSESETSPSQVEEPVKKVENVEATSEVISVPVRAEEPASELKSSKKKNKNNKKHSESDSASAQLEESAKTEEVTESSTAAPVDDLDFLDFVTTKDNRHAAAVAEEPVAEESVVTEQTSAKSKKNKKNKKHSESETSPSQVEEPVKKVEVPESTASAPPDDLDFLDFVTTKDNRHAAAVAEEPAAEESVVAESTTGKSKKNKKHKKHSESESSPSQIEEPVKKLEVQSTDSAPSDDLDFLDFVTTKDNRHADAVAEDPSVVEATVTEPTTGKSKKNKKNKKRSESEVEEPVNKVEVAASETKPEVVTTPASFEEPVVESKSSKKKNKKNKKHSESETAPAPTPAPAHVEEEVKKVEVTEEPVQKVAVAPQATASEPAETPVSEVPNESASKKKNKKKNKKGGAANAAEVVIPATEPEPEAQTVIIPSIIEQAPVTTDLKTIGKEVSVEELNYGEPTANVATNGTSEGSKKSKKNKNKKKKANSISVDIDSDEKQADDEVSAITGAHSPPIQVHEVTSTENGHEGTLTTTTIKTGKVLADVSPTRFQENVEKLVSATMIKHNITQIDPTVKMTIDAQLIKLSEKKPAVLIEAKNYIQQLPIEVHVSRPTTPARDRLYKLLPRDIVFCAGLIDSHGEDYTAMAADKRNIFKENARALQRKIRVFKESPHFQTYKRAKEENRPLEEVIAEDEAK